MGEGARRIDGDRSPQRRRRFVASSLLAEDAAEKIESPVMLVVKPQNGVTKIDRAVEVAGFIEVESAIQAGIGRTRNVQAHGSLAESATHLAQRVRAVQEARSTQGYRIWPRTDRAKAADRPKRFRFLRMEIPSLARLRMLWASLRMTARFSAAWSL